MRLSVSLFPRPGTLLERFIVLVLVFFNRPVQLHLLGRSSSMATRVPRLPQGLDASDFAWGGIISILGGPPFKTSDYWKPGIFASSDCSQASSYFYQCPKRRETFVCNARVAFLQPWQLQGVKSKLLKDTMKELHEKALSLLAIQIFSFSLSLLGPKINHADSSSRQLSDKGCCFLKSPCDVWTLLYLSDGSGL